MKNLLSILLGTVCLISALAFLRYAYLHGAMAGLLTLLVFVGMLAIIPVAFVWLVWDIFVRDASRGVRR